MKAIRQVTCFMSEIITITWFFCLREYIIHYFFNISHQNITQTTFSVVFISVLSDYAFKQVTELETVVVTISNSYNFYKRKNILKGI